MSFLAALLLLPPLASAPTDRIVERWSVEEGLPNNALTSVVQTRDGYLWIATWAGIVRFDGVRFTPVAEDLPNAHARVVFEDRAGAIWIGMAGGGLARWQAGRVSASGAETLARDDVRAIAQDSGGLIWVGTENGVSILEPGGLRSLRRAQGLPHDAVNGLAPSRDGRVWIATSGGVCAAGAREARCAALELPRDADAANAVLEDSAGRLWIGTRNGLISRNGEPGSPCARRCFPGKSVTSLLEGRDGSLWVGLASGGLARIYDRAIEYAGPAQGVPAGPVVTLREDFEGSLWAGIYYGGLVRLKPRRVASFSTADGLPTEAIGSIVERPDGSIWAGAQCGPVSELRGGRFVPRFAKHTRDACAWVLWPARDGALWIGTRGSGLFRWHAGRMEHFGSENGLSDDFVCALFEDRSGVLWIGTELGGLHTYAQGRLSRAYGPADGVATPYIASFAEDREGRIWIGSNANGLSVYERGRFRTLAAAESPPTRNIAGLLVDSRGDLWIGSAANGLFRRRHGRYEPFGVAEGLGDRLVAVMLEDRDANLWVATTRGISRLARERIEAVASGRERSLDPILLDRADGLRHNEGSGGGLDPSGLRDRQGRLWFSTIDGIAVIDPAAFRTNRLPPPLKIEGAHLLGRDVALSANATLAVPAGTPTLELSYTAFSLLAPSKVRFRYRLLGAGEEWQDVGGRRTAYYGKLPSGSYTFEVTAANNDGVWSTAPARVGVVVAPFWWERQSVRIGALLGLLLLTAASVRQVVLTRARSRVRELERERALERERLRIARDLHDDLGARLTHIALMSDRAQAGELSGRLSRAAREAFETLDELVWAVSARNDTVEAFAQYGSRFAEEHLQAAELRCRLDVEPELTAHMLPADARRHLFLAFKEALNNAIKHAQASEVHVQVAVVDGHLGVVVSDDGRGLPEGRRDPMGNGLTNMRERMQMAGGTLRVDSTPDTGTRIEFRVPLG